MFTQSFQKEEQVPIVMILQGHFFIFLNLQLRELRVLL